MNLAVPVLTAQVDHLVVMADSLDAGVQWCEATLGLTPATVRTYLRTAYAALGVSNKLELVAALRHQ